jgi:hypothetical protein
MGWMFPISSASCSINPDDCDGLYKAYSTAASKWDAVTNGTSATDAIFPTITPSPSLPACLNSSGSMSNDAFSKSFYGCGLCTIFGDEVKLMYFPEATTVSRDMCATTPSAKLTVYGKNVGLPYTGDDPSATWNGTGPPPKTAVVGTHTFTSGIAYISIKRVWAVDRCSSHIGTTVTSAVLALPSKSLLSLRYSQDHFQYFATTNEITGYPFNYADLNQPVPYSAWNGQARCSYPGAADWKCNVIYENDYNPQLAMPPGIRRLNPAWEGCQMWYGGLYDPPYALKPGTVVDTPTVAFGKPPVTTTSAAQASTAAPTTPTPTALPDLTTEQAGTTQGQDSNGDTQRTQEAEEMQVVNTASHDQNTQTTQTQDSAQNTQAAQSSQGGSQNNNGRNNHGESNNNNNNNNDQNQGGSRNTQGVAVTTKAVTVTIGTKVQTFPQVSSGIVKIGSAKLTPSGSAATLDDGSVVSADSESIKVGSTILKYPNVAPVFVVGPDVVVLKVGTKTVTASCHPGSTNQAVIGSVTLTGGGPVQTLEDGSRVSLASGGVIVVDSTSIAAIATPASAVVFTVDGNVVTVYQAADVSSIATINGTVISRDGPAITLSSGEVVSMGFNGLVLQQGSTIVPVCAFTTLSGEDDSSPSSGTSGSGSGSSAASNNTAINSTRTAQQNQGSQSITTGTSAGSIIRLSTTASILTITLLVSPLLFASTCSYFFLFLGMAFSPVCILPQ